MPSLLDFKSVKNKTVILRLDLNVPIEDGVIMNDFRLRKSLSTIKSLRIQNNKIIILSHLGRPNEGESDQNLSLRPVYEYLSENLDENINLKKNG